jgi:hypothetical protein
MPWCLQGVAVLAVAVWTVLHFSFLYAIRDLSTPEIDVLDCCLLLDVAGPSGTVGSTSWIACLALR